MKKLLFVLLFGSLTASLLAQQVSSDSAPDKRKNALYFSNGLQSKYREDTEGAIRNFEQALRHMPNDAASMFELSEQYYNAGRLEDAFGMSQKAASIDPENKWYQMRLGQFYRNLEQFHEFINIYEGLTKKYPEDLDMLSDLIDAYLVTEKYEKALEKMDLLEKQVGPNDFISEQRLNVLKRQGKNKKLISELEKLITQNPDNLRYYGMLAQIQAENGDDKAALKTYEKIKTINPNDPYINISLLEYYEATGDKESAFKELLSAIRNKNLDIGTKTTIYDFWMHKNNTSKKINEQVKQCAEAFIDTHPDNKTGYLLLGSYYMVKENAIKSKEAHQKALSLDSTDFRSWQNLIISESQLDETESVRNHAIAAMKYYPMQPVFYWYAGVASAMLKINKEAITFIEQGRRFTSDKKELASFDAFLGDLYYELGEEDKAFDAYERTLRNDPINALTLNNYAYYLAQRNQDLDKALGMSTQAISLDPDNPTFLDTHAWVLYMKGNYQEAEKYMKKAIKLLKEPDKVYQDHYDAIKRKLNN